MQPLTGTEHSPCPQPTGIQPQKQNLVRGSRSLPLSCLFFFGREAQGSGSRHILPFESKGFTSFNEPEVSGCLRIQQASGGSSSVLWYSASPCQACSRGLSRRVTWSGLSITDKPVRKTGWSWRQDKLGQYSLFYPSLAKSGRPSQQATPELGAVNGVMLGPQRRRGNQ